MHLIMSRLRAVLVQTRHTMILGYQTRYTGIYPWYGIYLGYSWNMNYTQGGPGGGMRRLPVEMRGSASEKEMRGKCETCFYPQGSHRRRSGAAGKFPFFETVLQNFFRSHFFSCSFALFRITKLSELATEVRC